MPSLGVYDVDAEMATRQTHQNQSAVGKWIRHSPSLLPEWIRPYNTEWPETLLSSHENSVIADTKDFFAKGQIVELQTSFLQDIKYAMPPEWRLRTIGQLFYDTAKEAAEHNDPHKLALIGVVVETIPSAEHIAFKIDGQTFSLKQMVQHVSKDRNQAAAFDKALDNGISRAILAQREHEMAEQREHAIAETKSPAPCAPATIEAPLATPKARAASVKQR